jgi:hypothetical protein
MKNKLITVILILCISTSYKDSFGSEKPTSRGEWFSIMMHTLKSRVYEAAEWVRTSNEVKSGVTTAVSIAGISGLSLVSFLVTHIEELGKLLTLPALVTSYFKYGGILKNPQVRETLEDNIFNFSVGLGIKSALSALVLNKIISLYDAGDMQKDNAVAQTKDIIRQMINDNFAYPTRSTKIHALLKKNEFLIDGGKDSDDIIAQACSELIQEITNIEQGVTKEKSDSVIDKHISDIRKIILPLGLSDQIEALSNDKDIALVRKLLANPVVKAKMSVLLRLENQQLIENMAPGTFEQTSSAVFYRDASKPGN